jgi:putative oxidoreductase
MQTASNVRVATTLLRVTLGIMFLTHSIVLKVLTFGFAGTAQYFVSIGLPAVTAYLVIAGEAIGGALLVFGIGTRYVALGLLPILLGATYVHSANGWVFSNSGGGWEYPLFLIIVSITVALLEKGRLPGLESRAAAAANG